MDLGQWHHLEGELTGKVVSLAPYRITKVAHYGTHRPTALLQDSVNPVPSECTRRYREFRLGVLLCCLGVVTSACSTSLSSHTRTGALSTGPFSPACTASELSASVGVVYGAGGQWMIPLQFRNVFSASCSLTGYPAVHFVNAADQPVGPPVHNGVDGDRVATITLAPGESAVARLYEVTEASANASPGGCNAVTAAAIRITQPVSRIVVGSQGAWVSALQVCSERPEVSPLMAAP